MGSPLRHETLVSIHALSIAPRKPQRHRRAWARGEFADAGVVPSRRSGGRRPRPGAAWLGNYVIRAAPALSSGL